MYQFNHQLRKVTVESVEYSFEKVKRVVMDEFPVLFGELCEPDYSIDEENIQKTPVFSFKKLEELVKEDEFFADDLLVELQS